MRVLLGALAQFHHQIEREREELKKKGGLTPVTYDSFVAWKAKKAEDPNHYFHLMKQLTLLGFFTSEPGANKALRYIAVPGHYDGCVPYKKGDKAWAT